MQKYMALYISLMVWRIMGGVVSLGSVTASLFILLLKDNIDIPIYATILLAAVVAGAGVCIGIVLFSMADYFQTAIDTAEYTKRISNQLDYLIKKGADHE